LSEEIFLLQIKGKFDNDDDDEADFLELLNITVLQRFHYILYPIKGVSLHDLIIILAWLCRSEAPLHCRVHSQLPTAIRQQHAFSAVDPMLWHEVPLALHLTVEDVISNYLLPDNCFATVGDA